MTTEHEHLIATVTSEGQPQEGQEHRSSGNFSTQGVPVGYSQFKWKVDGTQDPGSVSFTVMQDVSEETDPVIFEDLKHGSKTDIKKFREVYIADPSGTQGGTFTVSVYAIHGDS